MRLFFRLAAVGLTVAVPLAIVSPAQAANQGDWLTLTANQQTDVVSVAPGESVYFSGQAFAADGEPQTSVWVRLCIKGGKCVERVKTDKHGRWSVSVKATGPERTYRAKTSDPDTSSAPLTLKTDNWDRGIAERAKQTAGAFGKLTGTTRRASASRAGQVKASSVSWRTTKQGGLWVERTTDQGTRAYLVAGKIRAYYWRAGGPARSAWGVPIEDARCGLPSKGCLQAFTGGTAYVEGSSGRKAFVKGKGVVADLLAVETSQIGAQEARPFYSKGNKYSRYSTGTGSRHAWCAMFQSWAMWASGHERKGSKHTNFASYRDNWLGAHPDWRIKQPRPGALVVMDGQALHGHAAMVVSVAAGSYSVIAGNDGGDHKVRRYSIAKGSRHAIFYWPW